MNIFIVYRRDHLEEAQKRGEQGDMTICLDFILEQECIKRQITFIPLRNLVDAEKGEEEWWQLSHEVSREWYRLPAMYFFKHEGIRIAEAPEPTMQAHLARLFYYVRIFIILKKAYPGSYFSIPDPIAPHSSMTECLTLFVPWAVVEAAQMVSLSGAPLATHPIPAKYTFISAALKTKFLTWYNFFIGLLPRRSRKIYMSGYWPHAESLVPLMKDTEIILLESRNLLRIPWRQLLLHRMKVMYPHGPVSRSEEEIARKIGDGFLEKWKDAREQVATYLSSVKEELDWSPVLRACEHMIVYSPRVVADINRFKEIMKEEKPDLVLQMASTGGPQHYFFLMAKMARLLRIPSVELQHATVTSDPRSVYCRIETDYLLTYGTAINFWHEKIGNDRGRLISVGSPRFDKYVNEREKGIEKGKLLFKLLGLNPTKQVLLVVVPFSETYASAVDSYLLAEFFKVMSIVQKKVPGLQILFKCRNPRFISTTKESLKDLFSSDWAVTGDSDIFPLLCASDAVICNNSTVIYQTVLARKPLVLHPWKRFDCYHASIYSSHIPLVYTGEEAIEILRRIFADPTYRGDLMAQQEQFLKDYYFDGKSSQRTVEMLEKLAHKKSCHTSLL